MRMYRKSANREPEDRATAASHGDRYTRAISQTPPGRSPPSPSISLHAVNNTCQVYDLLGPLLCVLGISAASLDLRISKSIIVHAGGCREDGGLELYAVDYMYELVPVSSRAFLPCAISCDVVGKSVVS